MSCSTQSARHARREVGGVRGGADVCTATNGTAPWRSRGIQAKDGEDMQAFMNAISPGYFADDGHPHPGRPRLRPPRHEGRKPTSRSSTGSSRGTFSATRAPSAGTSAGAAGQSAKLDIEIVGVVADSLVRRAARRRASPGVRSELGQQWRSVLRAGDDSARQPRTRQCATR